MSNSIRVIHPYKFQGLWVFDDADAGLVKEPFVSGADEIIDQLVMNIPDAEQGFNLLFSDIPFPGHQITFERRQEEAGGYWYYAPSLDMEGWLCPALFKYFQEAPVKLYAQFKAKSR